MGSAENHYGNDIGNGLKIERNLFRLQALAVLAGRLPQVLGTVAATAQKYTLFYI